VTGASDIAFDQNNPKILFAGLWQTRRQPWKLTSGGAGSGLYRSADGGDTWKKLEGEGLPAGEWGKIGVRVAPSNPNVVYALIEAKDGGLFRSDDAGKTWGRTIKSVDVNIHGDHHDIWIDPDDPRRMIDGNDGGPAAPVRRVFIRRTIIMPMCPRNPGEARRTLSIAPVV